GRVAPPRREPFLLPRADGGHARRDRPGALRRVRGRDPGRLGAGRPRARMLVPPFEVPTPLAARSFRNFKSKSGTGIIKLLVPLSLPKFVPDRAAMGDELRKRGHYRRNTPGRLPAAQYNMTDTHEGASDS